MRLIHKLGINFEISQLVRKLGIDEGSESIKRWTSLIRFSKLSKKNTLGIR